LVGPPGIGKTRLSIETARESIGDFSDGVFFVPLAPLDDPSLIAATIVQTLGYVERTRKTDTETLKVGIEDKHLLLILDNCEHLIEDVAPLASDLLSACPRLKIIATSRESLRIPGEWQYPISTLELPEENSQIDAPTAAQVPAVALFVERARAVHPDFNLSANNVRAVISICNQLDGLPLAIELIASRIGLMSPQALLERMSGQFVLSADGMRAVSARQKTVKNAIQWSYDFLSSDEQRCFAFLSIFSGGFALEAAESIFSELFPEKTVTELITSLFNKSLLQRKINNQGDIRFSMLFTIQEFASDHLQHSDLHEKIRDRHVHYFADFAEQAAIKIHGPQQVEWLNRVEADHDNFRAALGWCVSRGSTETALRLLDALGWPWEMRCYYREAQDWLDRVRALPDVNKYPVHYSSILSHIGRQVWTQEDYDKAYTLLNESLAIASAAGEEGKQSLAGALNWLGLMLMFNIKDLDQARAFFETGQKIHQELNDSHGVALNTFHLGILASELGHYDDALHLLEKSLELFRHHGDMFFIGRVSIYLGYLFQKQEQYDRALFYFEQQLQLDTKLQFWDGIANGWFHIGDVYRQKGDLEQAEACYEQCRIICREHGLTKTVPTTK
jgi:predicted ATPase